MLVCHLAGELVTYATLNSIVFHFVDHMKGHMCHTHSGPEHLLCPCSLTTVYSKLVMYQSPEQLL